MSSINSNSSSASSIIDEERQLKLKTLKIVDSMRTSCRLCLQKEQTIDVFGKSSEDGPKYSEIAMGLANIEINENDDFPQFICTNCSENLQLFHEFKKKCELSHTTLTAVIPLANSIKNDNSGVSESQSISDEDISILDLNSIDENDSSDSDSSDSSLFLNLNETSDTSLKPEEISGDKTETHTKLSRTIVINENFDLEDYFENSKKNQAKTPPRKFQCEECGKIYTRNSDLHQHFNTHSGIKKFCCDLCKQQFTRKSHLSAHMLIHNQIKPYACDVCGHTFRKLSNMSRHKIIHEETFNFECNICGKMFRRQLALNKHKKIHSDTRPYECSECNSTYSTYGGFKKHCQKHLVDIKVQMVDVTYIDM